MPKEKGHMKRPADRPAAEQITLTVGDRVRLSELGMSRSPKSESHVGTVVGVPDPTKGGETIQVLFDGNKLPTAVHQSYIELG
jgi:hypothetical protein